MATYKVPCIHCNEMLERDAHYCPRCGSRSPFGYHCPSCLKPIARGYAICSSCGRALVTTCPYCNGPTFVGSERCDTCGQTLMIRCESKRCGELQFFENKKCTACGKPIKKAAKQIEAIKNGGK
jgi:RNA polymerase subunit RPABC4/transcription elongation factor Spt4